MDDESPRSRPRPRPAGGAAHAAAAERHTSRRWFLAGGGALVLGGGAGAAAALLRDHRSTPPPAAPGALTAAAASERRLIADLDATTGGDADVRRVITQLRADHAAHLSTLTGLLAPYRSPGASASATTGTARTRADLRTAEQRAAALAARRAESLGGTTAALLASIAACEATHAELLS